MSKLRDKLNLIEKDKIKKKWEIIDSQDGLSTREKLEKLVNLGLKREKFQRQPNEEDVQACIPAPEVFSEQEKNQAVIIREYVYPLGTRYGKFKLEDWQQISPRQLAILFGDEEFERINPMNLLFFDTETTGLAGGTGTIPFMQGFGFFDEDRFRVKIFILNDLAREDEFSEVVDAFIRSRDFSGTVTYNGKSFDFPLMETRYILQRKRFPLLTLPHLDFLFSARTLWKYTYDSRKLGHLGDVLLGLSREDDIEASRIPMIYFNYLRSKAFTLLQKVVEHNALDLLGMAGILLLAVKYQEDIGHTSDEGEILGTARLFEKYGELEKANQLYEELCQCAVRDDVRSRAVKNLALLKKKKKLYKEASELWATVADSCDHQVSRELSVHFEHREKDYVKACEYVQQALGFANLTEAQRSEFQNRLQRLMKKMKTMEKDD
ncbi:MAG: ribonuclease H-like domain-containing protein [Candidatus Omnitrophota bacterium]